MAIARHFDAIVIGAGQAGPSLAARLAGSGMNTALVEREFLGGTCVNTGCTPTKTLVASARAAHLARRAGDFGVVVDGAIEVDMARVKARKDAVVAASSRRLRAWLHSIDGCTVIEGHARFEGPRRVRVDGIGIEAERIFVNVGARAFVPSIPGLDDVGYLTNAEMMDVDSLPEHLIILGGSYIGLEFAQMYRRFGSRVTLVERGPRLIRRDDPEVSDAIRGILTDEGVEVRLNAECREVRRGEAGLSVRLGGAGEDELVNGSHLLMAVGRRPNTDQLDVHKAGIELDDRGFIPVDDQLQTCTPGIWALGDCNGRGAFTHTAYNDFEIVAANLLDGDPRRVSDRIDCYGLFVDPPLGRVGLSEAEARAAGHDLLVGRRSMERVARAREKGETRGFIKIVVDADSERILGAAILGVGGDEAIHCILDTMYAKQPYTVLQRAVHIHPTVAELIPTVLESLESVP